MVTVRFDHLAIGDAVRLLPGPTGHIGITISGHMMPDQPAGQGRGANIACAAISALAQNLFRSLVIIGGFDVGFQQESGHLKITVALATLDDSQRETARILIHSFLIGTMDVQSQYPDCITIGTGDFPDRTIERQQKEFHHGS